LLNTKKYGYYALSLISALLVLSLFEIIFFSFNEGHGPSFTINGFLLFNFSPLVMILAGSTAYRMIGDRATEESREKEKTAENLKSELSFLRSQISPHFMFNVINNIVALARKKSDLVEPSLIKLSSLMRYFLYEHDNDRVSLKKEIEYLQTYIDLQQQRFGSHLAVVTDFSKIDGEYEIEPMLLIPFVENAFKHGIHNDGRIDIRLQAVKGVLHFTVKNNYDEDGNSVKDDASGIGLANVRRRLKLLYEKRHLLLISTHGGHFKVSLELKLNG
jgi:LytS/YehU family sensor histidine kinase